MNTRQLLALVVILATTGGAAVAQAPQRATLSDGSVIWLSADGTWRADTSGAQPTKATGGYSTPQNATESLSILKKGSLNYDPSKWKQTQATQPGRFSFAHASGDGYAMVLSERLQLSPETLKGVVLNNARQAAPDAKIVFEERRVVNGRQILCLQIAGTTQGIPFRYFGYYYAGSEGTVQVLTYTGESLFEEYKGDFEELLNGFVAPGA